MEEIQRFQPGWWSLTLRRGESGGAGLDPAGHPTDDSEPASGRWGGWFGSLQGRCDLWNSGSEGKGGETREGKGKRTEEGGGEERCCEDLREVSAQGLQGGRGRLQRRLRVEARRGERQQGSRARKGERMITVRCCPEGRGRRQKGRLSIDPHWRGVSGLGELGRKVSGCGLHCSVP